MERTAGNLLVSFTGYLRRAEKDRETSPILGVPRAYLFRARPVHPSAPFWHVLKIVSEMRNRWRWKTMNNCDKHQDDQPRSPEDYAPWRLRQRSQDAHGHACCSQAGSRGDVCAAQHQELWGATVVAWGFFFWVVVWVVSFLYIVKIYKGILRYIKILKDILTYKTS